MNDTPNWTTPEYLSNLAADELAQAAGHHGIELAAFGRDDGQVSVSFRDLRDAETLVSLGVEEAGPGTAYDRATGGCVTITTAADAGGELTDEQMDAVFSSGWVWDAHPDMVGRRMGWHVSVTMSDQDANAVTANLNTLRNGGAL